MLCVRETQSLSICDVHITCRESHFVGVFNNPRLFCTEIIEMWRFGMRSMKEANTSCTTLEICFSCVKVAVSSSTLLGHS